MHGISVPSRFSCLKIEDDEFRPVTSKSSRKRSDANSNSKLIKTNVVEKTSRAKKSNGSKQNPVSNGNCTSKTAVKKTKSKHHQEVKQWEEWKRKDDEFVNENFEQDLRCAILQSKLEFENQKKNSVSPPQEKAKKKKPKPIPLDQFLDSNNKADSDKDKFEETTECDFFEDVIITAKEELQKEQFEETLRERNTNIEEVITLTQYQEKMKKLTEVNEQLKKELEEAKNEIAQVKTRNKTLCGMLSQGEMKDKAAVLLELEKLRAIKEELGEEVARLYKLLEQERSSTKTHPSNSESHGPKHKEKIKKKK